MEVTKENIWWLYAGDVGDIRIDRQVHTTSSTKAVSLSDVTAWHPEPVKPKAYSASSYKDFSVVKFLSVVNGVGVRMAMNMIGIADTAPVPFIGGFLRYVEGMLEDLDYLTEDDVAALARVKGTLTEMGVWDSSESVDWT